MKSGIALAVIGGTGVYRLTGIEWLESISCDTDYGPTSGPIRIAEIEGQRIA